MAVNQTNTGTVLKATFGTCLRDGVERIIMAFSERINAILNWTELNCYIQNNWATDINGVAKKKEKKKQHYFEQKNKQTKTHKKTPQKTTNNNKATEIQKTKYQRMNQDD